MVWLKEGMRIELCPDSPDYMGSRTSRGAGVVQSCEDETQIWVEWPNGQTRSHGSRKYWEKMFREVGAKSPKTKDTNPKDAIGISKSPMSCLPAPTILHLGLALMEGARKYGRHNYRVAGVRYSVYYDAAIRHLMQFWEGEDLDKDSGVSHIIKAMACLVVLHDSMLRGNATDDRPPKVADGWMDELNKAAAGLIEKYPESLPPFTEK